MPLRSLIYPPPPVDPLYLQLVVGIDPGPVPGIAALWFGYDDTITDAEFSFGQSDPDTCMDILSAWTSNTDPAHTLIGTEKFVVSQRAARSSDAEARDKTIRFIGKIHQFAEAEKIRLVIRPAGTVKPWATQERLTAARLYTPTVGSAHARSAAGQCLYTACYDGGHRDPLLKKE